MDDFTEGYIDAVLDGAFIDSLSPEALDFMLCECLTFSHNNKEFLLQHYPCQFGIAGKDFWLARNKTEVNFLTKFCNAYPPLKVFRSINGMIYI